MSAAGPSAPGAADGLATFLVENDVRDTDQIFHYDSTEVQKHLADKPWTRDPKYFKHVRISALALVKIVMHARSGGSLEVMGLLVGKIDPNYSRGPSIVIMDVFALPVEGTETRVNAQADAYEYMVEFQSRGERHPSCRTAGARGLRCRCAAPPLALHPSGPRT